MAVASLSDSQLALSVSKDASAQTSGKKGVQGFWGWGLLLLVCCCSALAQTAPRHRVLYRASSVLLGFTAGTSSRQVTVVIASVGAEYQRTVGSETYVLRVAPGSVPAVIQALKAHPEVRYAEPDYQAKANGVANDPFFSLQWALNNSGQSSGEQIGIAGADERVVSAWNITHGSKDMVVAVLDTGIDYNHPDLAANVWANPGGINGCAADTHGYNVLTAACDPMDDDTAYNGHGTHVAGIIGAVGNNGTGVAGVNWTTSLLAVKYLDATASGWASDLIAALDWVIQAKQAGVNIRVVIDSATFPDNAFSQALADELDKLGANDILLVAAAGNSAQNNDAAPRYPCSYGQANEICVTASDNTDRLWSSSNWGQTAVDLAAPGFSIYSTLRGGAYGYLSGSSMAAAEVAGAAALILSAGDQPATALKSTILNSVDVLPELEGLVRTSGRLDVCNAIPGCGSNTEIGEPTTVARSAGGTGSILRSTASAATANLPVFDVRAYPSLQAAIDAANAAGGGIVQLVQNTTYTGAITLQSKVTLSCVDRNTTITIANNTNTSVITISQGAANVEIDNCSIAGNGSNQTGTSNGVYMAPSSTGYANITLDNVSVDSVHDVAVFVGNTGTELSYYNQNVTIYNSSLTNCGTVCVQFQDTNNLWITNNYFYNWGARVATNDAIGAQGFNLNVHINGNTGVTYSSTYFFMESASSYFQNVIQNGDISGNVITAAPGAAGSALGFSGYFFNTVFTGNTHSGPSTGANACTHRAGYEIVGNYNTISNNTLVNASLVYSGTSQDSGGGQSNVYQGWFTVYNNNITQACASGDNGAIQIGGGDGIAWLQGGVISGNNVQFTAGTRTGIILGDYGVRGPVSHVQVTGNTIIGSGAGSSGISIYSLSSPETSDLTISNNQATNCGGNGVGVIAGDAYGDSFTVTNNDLRGCNGYGSAVSVNAGVTNQVVSANLTGSAPSPPVSTSSPNPSDFISYAMVLNDMVNAGQAATYTIAIAPNQSLQDTVTLTCAGLPSGAACSFSPLTPTAGSTALTSTLTLTTTAPQTTAVKLQNPRILAWALLLPPLALAVPIRRKGARNLRKLGALLSLCLVMVVLFANCGAAVNASSGQSDPPPSASTPSGTYTVIVNANTATFSHMCYIGLNVH